jgi:hypothetical protein
LAEGEKTKNSEAPAKAHSQVAAITKMRSQAPGENRRFQDRATTDKAMRPAALIKAAGIKLVASILGLLGGAGRVE